MNWVYNKEWLIDLICNSSLKSVLSVLRFNKPPIIIGGCGRSGTSLMLSILGSHSAIFSIPHETNVFTHKNRLSFGLDRFNNRRKLFRYLIKEKVVNTKLRYCEKTPKNVQFLEQIWSVEPKAIVILMVRDGRDVVTSIHPRTAMYHVEPERWIEDNLICRHYENHPQVCVVKYEELITYFTETMIKVCNFVGEEYEPNMKNFESRTTVKSHHAFHGHSVKSLHNTSINKWNKKGFQGRVELLLKSLEARELLNHFGYE